MEEQKGECCHLPPLTEGRAKPDRCSILSKIMQVENGQAPPEHELEQREQERPDAEVARMGSEETTPGQELSPELMGTEQHRDRGRGLEFCPGQQWAL